MSRAAPYQVAMLRFLGRHAWGAQHGREVFLKLAARLSEISEKMVNLDMSGVELMDASCSREVLANLVERYRNAKWFYLSEVDNSNVMDNIDMAFARKGMSIVVRHQDGDYQILGQELGSQHLETLEVIERMGEVTSRRVCDAIPGLSLTACNNRLKDLSDAGLVARAGGAAESGGREFIYWILR